LQHSCNIISSMPKEIEVRLGQEFITGNFPDPHIGKARHVAVKSMHGGTEFAALKIMEDETLALSGGIGTSHILEILDRVWTRGEIRTALTKRVGQKFADAYLEDLQQETFTLTVNI